MEITVKKVIDSLEKEILEKSEISVEEFTMKKVIELMEAFDNSKIASLSIKNKDFNIKMKKPEACVRRVVNNATNDNQNIEQIAQNVVDSIPVAKQESAGIEKSDKLEEITTPIVGTYYSAASPDSKPYVKVGDMVQEGDVVALVEAMKMMNEIKTHCSGIIKNILVKNEDVVSYSQVLMEIERI